MPSFLLQIRCVFYPKMDLKRYDRQIRVFGRETQNRIYQTKVVIHSKNVNYIAAEILKNILLLGFSEICINESVGESVKLLLFDDVQQISAAKISYTSEEIDCDIYVSICDIEYYFCCSCLSFSTSLHKCEKKTNEPHLEMLIGSIFVQEIIKKLKGDKHVNEYTLQI